MDKFTLYDFLSFFLPGVLATFMGYQCLPVYGGTLRSMGDVADGLLFTMVALIVGLAIHRLTFRLLAYSWYKRFLYPSIGQLLTNVPAGITILYDKLHKDYNPLKLNEEQLFDEAYYYLEYNDKIASAKAFQSMYFFLRNLVTLGMLVLWLLPIVAFFDLYFSSWVQALYYALAIVVLMGLLAHLAIFYRLKMVERIFNSFYTAMRYKDKKD